MPKKPKINAAELRERVRDHLLRGPSSAKEICRALGISQAAFSRVSSGWGEALLSLGAGPSTQYALRREMSGVGTEVPLYRIDARGKARRVGVLCSIFPRGFYWAGNEGEIFSDLPYFFEDLKPAGFLGRLVPRQHPELDLPVDLNFWNRDQCLRYLSRFGWNLIGNWLVGEEAFRLYLARQEGGSVSLAARPKVYAKMALDVLLEGEAGSSAGGEQPKFLAAKGPKSVPVIVKFSPKENGAVSVRRADLLVCESLALEVLSLHGKTVAQAEVLRGEQRTFLEMERFDRAGKHGRRGMISLKALDLEFAGKGKGWGAVARELLRAKILRPEDCREIEWLELFGKLIANSDMHLGNFSLFEEDLKITGLCPVYDMLPMFYAPQNEQIVEREFHPPLPAPGEAEIWKEVLPAAQKFWEAVAKEKEISTGFRKIAKENKKKLDALVEMVGRLPE
jgi:hypothetical protein